MSCRVMAAGTGVRHVRCPKCHSLLQEPAAPVYQCGGCGTTLRAKNSSLHRNDDAVSPAVSVSNFPRATKDELPDASSTKKHSGEATRDEPAPKSKPSRRDAAAGGGGKVRSSGDVATTPTPAAPTKKAEQDLAPLREKILKTVHALKGDLSDLFSKSPDLDPTKRPRPPRLPRQQEGGHASRGVKHGHQVASAAPLRGLPSRRYRRCRADPPRCDNNAQRTSCGRHGCCGHHHGKPECGRPARAHQPPSAPRHHCRPVLKGAPFIICSSCFTLVQVPAVSTNALRRLRCGSCSAVLSYSYRDPARKKNSFSADGFGPSSYSTTEDEQPPLHVSRNNTIDGVKGEGRLHCLMGYGSPDLYDDRTTPDYDRKGKSVCIDDDHEDGGVLKRSPARGAVWPLPGIDARQGTGSHQHQVVAGSHSI